MFYWTVYDKNIKLVKKKNNKKHQWTSELKWFFPTQVVLLNEPMDQWNPGHLSTFIKYENWTFMRINFNSPEHCWCTWGMGGKLDASLCVNSVHLHVELCSGVLRSVSPAERGVRSNVIGFSSSCQRTHYHNYSLDSPSYLTDVNSMTCGETFKLNLLGLKCFYLINTLADAH